MINRRLLLSSLLVLPIAGTLKILFAENIRPMLQNVIAMHFGEEVADSPTAQTFFDEWLVELERLGKMTEVMDVKSGLTNFAPHWVLEDLDSFDGMENWIVGDFCNQTNVILHLERGDELLHTGKIDAYESVCSHPLSTNFL